MNKKLEKIKGLLELSIEDSARKDMLIGQAIGLVDSMLEDDVQTAPFTVPNAVLKHMETPKGETMMDAVKRHKEVHTELSKDSISQQNTQFKKLS